MHHDKEAEKKDTVLETARDEKVSELEILKQSLDEKKKQAGDYYDQLLRLRAEFDNFRKRTERDKKNHLAWGKEEILLKQVSLLDVIEQAASIKLTENNAKSIQQGLELIKQEFVKMLSSEGIVEIECLGGKFDPNLHEAIEQVESEDEEETVKEVFQKGYMLNNRVIRPAKVKVSKKTAKKE
ncbi:MAG: nucleotide exchange factor GrpE [Endomicrobiales bacterium]|nr:nucleotide exchange factor GrpE [Endomicrobiales bacterium]